MREIFNLDGPVMVALGRLWDLCWLNILTAICCIPIVTAGPAITAMYYVTMKMVRGEDGYITRQFFKSFKENFKQSTILWLLMLLLWTILGFDIRIIFQMEQSYAGMLLAVIIAISIFCFMTTIYIFPLQARFDNPCKGTIKNAFILALTQLPKTIFVVVIHILPVAIMYFVPALIPVIFILGITLPAYGSSYVFVGIFKKIEGVENLDGEDEQEEIEAI